MVVLARVRTGLVGVIQPAAFLDRRFTAVSNAFIVSRRSFTAPIAPPTVNRRTDPKSPPIQLATAADDELRLIANPAPMQRLGLKLSIEQIGRDGWGRDRSSS